MEYTFGGHKLTLKKNTYITEQKAKEAAGIKDEDERNFRLLMRELQNVLLRIDSATDETRPALLEQMTILQDKVESEKERVDWSRDFEKVKKVFAVIFVEDTTFLTDEMLGRFDALDVWENFLTSPYQNKSDSKK